MQSWPPVEQLADRLTRLMGAARRTAVGIAGLPGAGKTTVARALVAAMGARLGPDTVAHVPMDGFHLADVILDRLGLRDVKGHPATFDAWGYAALLARLRSDTEETVYAPGFERDLEQALAGAVAVPPTVRLVVTEGNYLLLPGPAWSAARSALDEVWWVQAEEDLRLARLVARHVAFGKTPEQASAWVARSDEANARLIRERSVAADLVVTVA